VAPSSLARQHAALARRNAVQPCAVPLGPPCAVPPALTFVARHAEPQAWPREPRQAFRLHADAVLPLLPAYQRPAPLPAAACLFVLSFFPPPGQVPSFNRLNGGGFVNRRFHRGDVIGDERFLISGDRLTRRGHRFALLALFARRRSINSAVGYASAGKPILT
jgi:hypothetical protein